jgi:hypothetical protein
VSLWSDISGILAGFFLMLPAAKDNIYRFIERYHQQSQSGASFPGLAVMLAEVWRERRDSYSAFDTLCILLGGLSLVVSFALKLASS